MEDLKLDRLHARLPVSDVRGEKISASTAVRQLTNRRARQRLGAPHSSRGEGSSR